MRPKGITDEQFIEVWNRLGSPTLVAKELNLSIRNCQERRSKLNLETWNDTSVRRKVIKSHEGRIDLTIEKGTIIVFSDAHFWPNVRTTAFRGLLALIKQLKPVAIICNGDAFDGGTISKYPRIGWDNKPTVKEEIDAVTSFLWEIYQTGREIGCSTFCWPLGNHDARFETKLASAAPQFEGVKGFALKDHFVEWKPCWTTWINDVTCITHFYHTGLHDTHNNVLKAQVNYISGHTHSLKWTPWTDATGHTKYGVNTGTLANALDSHNADYQQGRHGNHRSGFAVLTYRDYKLQMPELVSVWDEDTIEFRGHLLDADTGEIV